MVSSRLRGGRLCRTSRHVYRPNSSRQLVSADFPGETLRFFGSLAPPNPFASRQSLLSFSLAPGQDIHAEIHGNEHHGVAAGEPTENSFHGGVRGLVNQSGWDTDDLGSNDIVGFPSEAVVFPVNFSHFLGRILSAPMAGEATLIVDPDRRTVVKRGAFRGLPSANKVGFGRCFVEDIYDVSLPFQSPVPGWLG